MHNLSLECCWIVRGFDALSQRPPRPSICRSRCIFLPESSTLLLLPPYLMDSTDSINKIKSSTPELSLFLPVLDEEENLREMHAKIAAALDTLGKSAEVIFVDDGSTDNSLD